MSGDKIICKECGAEHRWTPQLAGRFVHCSCGTVIPVAPTPGASDAAQLYADRIPRRQMIEEPVPRRSKYGMIIAAGLLLFGTAAGGWYLYYQQTRYPGPLAADDAIIVDYLKDNSAVEVREWLGKTESRILLGMSRDQANRFIDRLYEMGSVKVRTCGGQIAITLVVELPSDPIKRKTLFDWRRDWEDFLYHPPPRDVGQRYMLVGMRP